jgi:hypothetical protein
VRPRHQDGAVVAVSLVPGAGRGAVTWPAASSSCPLHLAGPIVGRQNSASDRGAISFLILPPGLGCLKRSIPLADVRVSLRSSPTGPRPRDRRPTSPRRRSPNSRPSPTWSPASSAATARDRRQHPSPRRLPARSSVRSSIVADRRGARHTVEVGQGRRLIAVQKRARHRLAKSAARNYSDLLSYYSDR